MTQRRGADLLADILQKEGVRYVFCNPGTTELPVIEAVADRLVFSYVLGLQEASVVAMADGYDGMDAPREPGSGWPYFSISMGDITMDVKVIGIDIAKRYFQVHGVSASGAVMIWRKVSRDSFLKLLADLSPPSRC